MNTDISIHLSYMCKHANIYNIPQLVYDEVDGHVRTATTYKRPAQSPNHIGTNDKMAETDILVTHECAWKGQQLFGRDFGQVVRLQVHFV